MKQKGSLWLTVKRAVENETKTNDIISKLFWLRADFRSVSKTRETREILMTTFQERLDVECHRLWEDFLTLLILTFEIWESDAPIMSLLCPWTLEIENNIFSFIELQTIGFKWLVNANILSLIYGEIVWLCCSYLWPIDRSFLRNHKQKRMTDIKLWLGRNACDSLYSTISSWGNSRKWSVYPFRLYNCRTTWTRADGKGTAQTSLGR